MKDEVTRLGAQRIETGWRGLAGATNDGGSSSCPAQRQLEEGIGMAWTEASRPAQGEERRRGAIADAWTRSPATSGGMGVGGVTVETLELTVDSFEQF